MTTPRFILICLIASSGWDGLLVTTSRAMADETNSRQTCLSILQTALKSDQFWPAMHAAEGLTAVGHHAEVSKHLKQRWKSTHDDQQQCGIARELVRAGDNSFVGMLSYRLADPASTGRVHAAESLFKLGLLGDKATLRRAAKSEDQGLRQMSLAALARSGDIVAHQQILDDLKAQNETIRRRAAWILGVIGNEQDRQAVQNAAREDAEPLEKAEFDHTLVTLGDEQAMASLNDHLTSDVAAIRANAAYYAGAARLVQTEPTLLALLNDPVADVKIRAAASWLQLQDQEQPPKTITPQSAAPDYLRLAAAKMEPNQKILYQTIGDQSLKLHLFTPPEWKKSDSRPCLITIHGGGWTGGEPRRMYPFCDYFAHRGMVAISIEYRLLNPRRGVTVFDSVRDARSAVRYIRGHAKELGIDPQQIVACGASAGGHLAVGAALFDQVDEDSSAIQVAATPDALALLFPVIDTSPAGYGSAKLGDRWRELSPADNVRADLPPTIMLHGTGDTVTPFAGVKKFHLAMNEAGNRCDLHVNKAGRHGYLMFDLGLYYEALQQLNTFLTSLKFLPYDDSAIRSSSKRSVPASPSE
ncbi:alpha/beta hydrolase fold domain-containing protein [Blastopirellula marina]|uniref:Probable lipase/esterase n=1 Tax=Blastopirellula marina DSM 3645 TaxID=314230 RepID=A3ZY95_9BACT|nr:alpha/beta hydrolase fold domain-containing protein [Blastopirellula marina]EAQ78571.1 probable lipase/esterase [Blastopirellula marina DSM 3645]